MGRLVQFFTKEPSPWLSLSIIIEWFGRSYDYGWLLRTTSTLSLRISSLIKSDHLCITSGGHLVLGTGRTAAALGEFPWTLTKGGGRKRPYVRTYWADCRRAHCSPPHVSRSISQLISRESLAAKDVFSSVTMRIKHTTIRSSLSLCP